MLHAVGNKSNMAMSEEAQLDLTRCAICFEIFKVPKQLPCLHSFCETCLQSYITEVFNKDSVSTKGIHCPICRAFIDKREEQDFQEWGITFPTNHLLNNIIDYTKSKNESTLCNVCERENESIQTASYWCVNCSDAMCTQCERQHRKFKLSAQHKLVEIDKMRDSEPEGLLYGAEVLCDDHQSESIRFYCVDHKSVCCMTCMMLNHRKCDDVGSIEDCAKTVKTSTEVETLETKLKGLKSGFENLMQNREENIQRFKIQLGETEEIIETSFDDVIHHLKIAKTEMIDELRAKEKEVIPQLQDDKSELECKVAGIANDLAILVSTSRHAPPARYLQSVRSLVEQRKKLEIELKKKTSQLRNHDLEYTRNDTLATIKEVENLFGYILVSQKDLPARIQLVKTINVEGHVTGVDFVDDSRIILRSGISTLNLIHMNGSALYSVEFPNKIWSVHMDNAEEGYVVILGKGLQFFKILGNEIMLTCTNKLEYEGTKDFFFSKEKHLFVGGNKRISILDNSLNKVREIAVEHTVGYMDLRDEHSICYSVYLGDTLFCIDLNGKQIFSYTHEKLLETTGVTVNSRGQIYVSGGKSRNIHQLNHDGQLQRILFDDLPSFTYRMSFNDAEDKVVIGCYGCVLLYDFC